MLDARGGGARRQRRGPAAEPPARVHRDGDDHPRRRRHADRGHPGPAARAEVTAARTGLQLLPKSAFCGGGAGSARGQSRGDPSNPATRRTVRIGGRRSGRSRPVRHRRDVRATTTATWTGPWRSSGRRPRPARTRSSSRPTRPTPSPSTSTPRVPPLRGRTSCGPTGACTTSTARRTRPWEWHQPIFELARELGIARVLQPVRPDRGRLPGGPGRAAATRSRRPRSSTCR